MDNQLDPAEALAIARGARERVAARAAAAPGWYAPIYGLCCGGLVMGGGLPQPLGIICVAVSISAVGVLYRSWQEKTGLSVGGYRKGRTRTVAVGLAVMLVALMIGGLIARMEYGLGWAPFACGATAAILATLGSHLWDRAWRAEMMGSGQ